jgi:hypothetical protein
MYIECQGSGSPTVLLISGNDAASDMWHAADQKGPTVYDDIQKMTRVCAYDRPGAPHLDQTLSRSDPVPRTGQSFRTRTRARTSLGVYYAAADVGFCVGFRMPA